MSIDTYRIAKEFDESFGTTMEPRMSNCRGHLKIVVCEALN